jgi:hypothetical protein
LLWLEGYHKSLANELGIAPAQAQAAIWLGAPLAAAPTAVDAFSRSWRQKKIVRQQVLWHFRPDING